MINKNELRIGNWISDIHASEKGMWQVTALLKTKCHYGSVNYISPYENLKPIPLSPSILEGCGSKHLIQGIYKISLTDTLFIQIEFTGECVVVGIKNTAGYITIKIFNNFYVHQFQNLYYSLTQTELKIQLDQIK